jgi:hypothetical protein
MPDRPAQGKLTIARRRGFGRLQSVRGQKILGDAVAGAVHFLCE